MWTCKFNDAKTLSASKSQIKSERQYLSIVKNFKSFVVKLETLRPCAERIGKFRNSQTFSQCKTYSACIKCGVSCTSNPWSNERFSNLATISINRELTPKIDAVIKKFWLSKDRKAGLAFVSFVNEFVPLYLFYNSIFLLLRTENERKGTNQNENFVTVPFLIFLNVKQFVRSVPNFDDSKSH